MDVYLASDGSLIRLDSTLAEYESIEHLYDEVSRQSDIVMQNVLMFLHDGREMRQEILEEAWDRGGEGGTSSGTRTVLYLFDRETFWTDAEENAARYTEEVQLPPQLPLSAIHDFNLIQQPFILTSDHIQHLQSLFLAQSQALSIAYSNLFFHLSPFISEFEAFAPKAEKELDADDELIRGSKGDMVMLGKIVIHEQLRKRGEKEKDKDREKRLLGDHVNASKMEQVRDTCRVAHEGHVARYNDLISAVEELIAQSDVERRAAEERSTAIGEEFDEALGRIELALSQVEILVGGGLDGALQDLVELDRAMREDLITITQIKNDFTVDLHAHLRQIAHFQSQVVSLAPQVSQLENDLASTSSSKAAFPHLYRLRNLPFAYSASVVEIVRRKEYGQFLSEWTSKLKEVLTRFTSKENTRRSKIREDVISHLPFTLPALDDSMRVGVELSVSNGLEVLKGVVLERKDVDGLLQWIESLRDDPEILGAIAEGDMGPVRFLEEHLGVLISQMGVASDELDKMVQEAVLDRPHIRASQSQAVDQQDLEAARQDWEKRIADMQTVHEREISELKDRHEERTSQLHSRQGELQEELVRLRTDLEEENLARQALSAQLEETAREQEDRRREVEDQADLVTALQAELLQEKDRATDLGVRLQEALLDVDGLRNAEQTLITQLHGLQDERSKSIQALSDEQVRNNALESQLAGLKAELDATTAQLSTARGERDTALKNQSAEAERMMRDHIAEADGDRAVLEHQNLTLTKQLEDSKQEHLKKLSEVENQAVRTANGLKAELSFTKAQLRTAQQKETVLADELAMSKDTSDQLAQNMERQAEVCKEAVALVGLYWETCSRLAGVISASSTISGGSSHGFKSRDGSLGAAGSIVEGPTGNARDGKGIMSGTSKSPSKEELKDSAVLNKSLATAQTFDIGAFSDSVMKTINLVKKWGKSCKTYRDLSRNRLSFRDFGKGDLALFLPTRNAAAKAWACFNVAAPHNFLKADPPLLEQISQREWMIARIVQTEEAVASGGESPVTNPFGLADGLRYWVHTVEEYNPAAIRPPRKSASSYYGRSIDDTASNQVTPVRPLAQSNRVDNNTELRSSIQTKGSGTVTSPPESVITITKDAEPLEPESPSISRRLSSVEPEDDPEESSQSDPTPILSQSPRGENQADVASAADAGKLTTVLESLSISEQDPVSPPPKQDAPVAQTQPVLPTQEGLAGAFEPTPQAIRPPIFHSANPSIPNSPEAPSRSSSRLHHNAPARLSSPPSRDYPSLFAPSTFGRPPSISSNHSYARAPFATGKAAPAMAVTTSNPSNRATSSNATLSADELNPFMETTRTRRKSSAQSLVQPEELARPGPSPMNPTQVSGGSPNNSGRETVSPIFMQSTGGSGHKGSGLGAGAARETQTATPSPGTSPGAGASRLMRGFSIRKRTPSGIVDSPPAPQKPSAMDILRRFDGSGTG